MISLHFLDKIIFIYSFSWVCVNFFRNDIGPSLQFVVTYGFMFNKTASICFQADGGVTPLMYAQLLAIYLYQNDL